MSSKPRIEFGWAVPAVVSALAIWAAGFLTWLGAMT